ncbi:MAG: hypothetical protein PHH28_13845 [Desulfuromonadaceae bacterium]|nr:hypothetical protein [Desulfuromonadaceae bacterium]
MNTIDLNNKKILFVAPKFFGYEIQIVEAMQKFGATVFFHSDKPSENRWAKVILRLFPKLIWFFADRVYFSWLNKQNLIGCDVVFILKGEAVSPNFLRALRERYSSAKFVLYMYDSIANVKYTEQKFAYFDRVLSFDPNDCQRYSQIKYRPLFFIDNYRQQATAEAMPGLFFLGTLNGDRPQVLARVIHAIGKSVPFDYSLFVRSKLELLMRKLIDKSFAVIESNRLLFESVSAAEIKQHMAACNCVLDIEHPKQAGLTMRTFEVLAAGKKLITTNQTIFNEDFFDPSRMYVIDRLNPIIPEMFFNMPCNPMKDSFYKKNSLEGWLEEVLHEM